jgi:hypothetical protein
MLLACHPRGLPSQAGGVPCGNQAETSLKEAGFGQILFTHLVSYRLPRMFLCTLHVCVFHFKWHRFSAARLDALYSRYGISWYIVPVGLFSHATC